MINWWITENGGKLVHRKRDGGNIIMIDDESYTTHISSSISTTSFDALNKYANILNNDGWKIDTNGYTTMFRVYERDDISSSSSSNDDCKDIDGNIDGNDQSCKTDVEKIMIEDKKTLIGVMSRLPTGLSSSYDSSKGYLDIQIQGISKQSSINWLTKKLARKANVNNKEKYLFMGCDKDITSGSAIHTYVITPCEYIKSKSEKITLSTMNGLQGSSQLLANVLSKLLSM